MLFLKHQSKHREQKAYYYNNHLALLLRLFAPVPSHIQQIIHDFAEFNSKVCPGNQLYQFPSHMIYQSIKQDDEFVYHVQDRVYKHGTTEQCFCCGRPRKRRNKIIQCD